METKPTKGTTVAVRYLVAVRFAFDSEDGYTHSYVVAAFPSRADALAAGSAWFDLGAERFCGHEPSAWQFTPVDLS